MLKKSVAFIMSSLLLVPTLGLAFCDLDNGKTTKSPPLQIMNINVSLNQSLNMVRRVLKDGTECSNQLETTLSEDAIELPNLRELTDADNFVIRVRNDQTADQQTTANQTICQLKKDGFYRSSQLFKGLGDPHFEKLPQKGPFLWIAGSLPQYSLKVKSGLNLIHFTACNVRDLIGDICRNPIAVLDLNLTVVIKEPTKPTNGPSMSFTVPRCD
ncbi:MAG: hypothetical protein C5B49_04430 [Bdellovibrio sp.]|nr:MAG: hypothetical protein C5B49_04430 [Bdellovibrio sp.]